MLSIFGFDVMLCYVMLYYETVWMNWKNEFYFSYLTHLQKTITNSIDFISNAMKWSIAS